MNTESFRLNYSRSVKDNVWYEPDHSKPLLCVGNTGNLIDWEKIIDILKDKPGKKLPNIDWDNEQVNGLYALFNQSNYIPSSAEWINYYPNIDYDSEIDSIFANIVNKPNIVRAWISKIEPGKTAPWHYDVDDDEESYLSKGELVRYSCKVSEPADGHFTMVGNNSLYNALTGDIYQWPDHRMWHGGANAGFVSKYQYNVLAYV
jgi:hypothetical protein